MKNSGVLYDPPPGWELKVAYPRNMLLAVATVAGVFGTCIGVWMFFHPRSQMTTISVDRASELVTQVTLKAAEYRKLGGATPGSTMFLPLVNGQTFKVIPDVTPVVEMVAVPSTSSQDALDTTSAIPGDGSRFAAVDPYYARLTPVTDQKPTLQSPEPLTPVQPFDLKGIRGIGSGSIVIPGDTLKGDLVISALRQAAKHMMMRPGDSIKVTAEMIIDDGGNICRWNVLSEHPKKSGEMVYFYLRNTKHRTSWIGGERVPTYIKRTFIICNLCQDADVLLSESVIVLSPGSDLTVKN